ncbi:MAG: TetR/AcrR family transcriptional regulator [Deltaproteobacteria bacterium]|nr:TetR/AcrR family transcriptional regulator [Deltaproteobacteria bacterium]
MSRKEVAKTKKSPRARRRAANLERIVEAAVQVAVEDGVDELSIKKVAELADYTPGALYRYFDSKDALLAAVAERVIGELRERIAEADDAAASPLVRIGAQVRAYHAFATGDDHGFQIIAVMIGDPRVLLPDNAEAAKVMHAMIGALSPLAVALEAAGREGSLEPAKPATPELAAERAMLLFSAFHGALQLRKQARMAPDLIHTDRIAFETARLILRGWGASTEALDAALPQPFPR